MSEEPSTGSGEPTPEELIREMARRLAETPVRDILLQTMGTFGDLAGVRLGYGPGGADQRDLAQARLAIEVVRALIGVVEAELGAAQARPFREPFAQLQMLYAQAVEEEAKRAEASAEREDEQPASGLWTPGGERSEGGGSGLWTPGGTDPQE